MVSGVGLDMGVLDFGGDRRRGRGSLGVNLWRPIVTNGDFVASLRESAYNDRAVVWRGEWGGTRHSCVRWKSTCLKGKGLFLAWFLALLGIFVQYFTMATYGYTDILIDNRLVCEKLAVFPYARIPLNSVSNSLSYDIARFKIEVGVEEKFMCKGYDHRWKYRVTGGKYFLISRLDLQ